MGSSGKDVTSVQLRLIALGYKLPRYGADGKFGNETKAAVIAFQKDAFPSQPKEHDGIVGPKTWNALFTSGKSPEATTPGPIKAPANNNSGGTTKPPANNGGNYDVPIGPLTPDTGGGSTGKTGKLQGTPMKAIASGQVTISLRNPTIDFDGGAAFARVPVYYNITVLYVLSGNQKSIYEIIATFTVYNTPSLLNSAFAAFPGNVYINGVEPKYKNVVPSLAFRYSANQRI